VLVNSSHRVLLQKGGSSSGKVGGQQRWTGMTAVFYWIDDDRDHLATLYLTKIVLLVIDYTILHDLWRLYQS
jgi:hypothetical protein